MAMSPGESWTDRVVSPSSKEVEMERKPSPSAPLRVWCLKSLTGLEVMLMGWFLPKG